MAGFIDLMQLRLARQHLPCGRKVGAANVAHQTTSIDLRLVDKRQAGVDHFPGVMGWNRGRHTNGNTLNAVHQQVR